MAILNRATIALRKETRELLSNLGRKNQSYDQVIMELVRSKNKLDLLEGKTANLSSSKSAIP
jgi:predicted CopG family antitoxin